MLKVKNIVASLDLIGHPIQASFQGKYVQPTFFGGILSTVLLTISCIALWFFGKELVLREKPIIRSYTQIDQDLVAPISEFPAIFSVWSESGPNVTLEENFDKEFKFSGDILSFVRIDNGPIFPTITPFPVVRCSRTIMGEVGADHYIALGVELKDFLCMDLRGIPEEERIIAKSFTAPGNKSIRLYVDLCDPEKVANCGTLFKKYGDLRLNTAFIDSFADISNFSKPVEPFLNNFAFPFQQNQQVDTKYSAYLNTIITDEGSIFSSVKEEKFTTIENYERNFVSFNKTSRRLASLSIGINVKENIIERQYLKVQELLANMGGFVKGITFICKVLNLGNGDVSLFNKVMELKKNVKKRKIPIGKTESEIDISAINVKQEELNVSKSYSLWDFYKNILTCKFKQNTLMKNKALKYLDLVEMIKLKQKVKQIEEKEVPQAKRNNFVSK